MKASSVHIVFVERDSWTVEKNTDQLQAAVRDANMWVQTGKLSMKTTRVFVDEIGPAILLPDEFAYPDGTELTIHRSGDVITIYPTNPAPPRNLEPAPLTDKTK